MRSIGRRRVDPLKIAFGDRQEMIGEPAQGVCRGDLVADLGNIGVVGMPMGLAPTLERARCRCVKDRVGSRGVAIFIEVDVNLPVLHVPSGVGGSSGGRRGRGRLCGRRPLGCMGIVLELRVGTWEEQRLVTVVGPLHQVWRRTAGATDLQDLSVPYGLAEGWSGDHDPVANRGSHDRSLPGRLFTATPFGFDVDHPPGRNGVSVPKGRVTGGRRSRTPWATVLRPGSGPKTFVLATNGGMRSAGRAAGMAHMVERNGLAAAGPGRVVVGVNGALAGCRQALVFAAHEARLRNAALRLVHGCEPLATLTERQPAVPLVARERQARRQLRDAAEALRPLLDPGTRVEFHIDPRTGVDALLDESTSADLIVVQRRDLTSLGRVTAGSTSSAVAARAHCPVAVTRAGLGSAHHRSGVVLGVDGQAGPDAAMPLAFMEAAVRRVQLTIHVLTQGDGAEEHVSWANKASAAAHDRARSALAEAIDRYAGSFPNVVVSQIVVAGDAVDALSETTATAELLVIGRHDGTGT